MPRTANRMLHNTIRIIIALLTGFVALTAIGGGVAMLIGADRFPLDWLQGTPFADYTFPALLLAFCVGGSSLAATVALFISPRLGAPVAMVAGILLTGYVVVEVLILKQVPPGPTPTEVFYICLGLLILLLAAYLRRRQQGPISADR